MANLHRIGFNFHAHGHGLSGEFRHPLWSIIHAQASGSLVEKIETKLSGVDLKRHLIEVKNFGKIFLAEIFAYPGTKTLTMLRLELGSPHVADLTVGETGGNGQPT